jgi:hypothetical protein
MKKYLRPLTLLLLISHFSFLITSCTQELYEKGDGEFSQLRADLVNVHVRHDSRVDYVLTDDGDSLRTEPPFTVSWIEKSDTIYRALLYYYLNDGVVEAYSMGPVLVTSIKDANLIKGGIKTDAVHLTSLWRARSGKYLNMRLRVMTGTTEDEKMGKQTFGCVSDTVVSHPDGRRTQHLRLYHDQGGQPEYYSKEVYLSIPLKDTEADTLLLQVNTYDGLKEKRFVLTP